MVRRFIFINNNMPHIHHLKFRQGLTLSQMVKIGCLSPLHFIHYFRILFEWITFLGGNLTRVSIFEVCVPCFNDFGRIDISQAEVIIIPQHRLYVHLHHIYAVAHPPDSGNCVFHVIDVSHFCGSVCDIEIDGRLFRIRNLPNVDKLLIGVEVEPSHLINIAVAEPID